MPDNLPAAPPVSPMDAFQEKVLAKLRDDIAAMLPDEALAALVQRCVHEQFFAKRKEKVKDGYYSEKEVERPSWFVTEVSKLAEPILRAEVARYVGANKDLVLQAVTDFLKDQNLLLLAMAQLRHDTMHDIHMGLAPLLQAIKEHR